MARIKNVIYISVCVSVYVCMCVCVQCVIEMKMLNAKIIKTQYANTYAAKKNQL